jgi:microcystin-dependent protein
MTVNVGEIRLFAGRRVPTGWMICDGRSLDTGTYSQLYTAIGKTYGSTGPSSFNLPDLSARVPIHRGAAYPLGVTGGAETVTLTAAQIPTHNHTLSGTETPATLTAPDGNLPAQSSRFDGYQASVPGAQQMGSTSISVEGGAPKAHENLQPFLCINYIIAAFPAPLPAAKSKPAAPAKAAAKAKPSAKAKPAAKKQGSAKGKPVAKTKAAKAKPSRKSKSAKVAKAKAPKTRRAAPARAKRAGKATRKAPAKRNAARKSAPRKGASKATPGKRSAPRTASKRARR